MKHIVLILLNWIPILVFGQLLPDLLTYSGNIEYVVQKKYGKVNSVIVTPQGNYALGDHYGFTGVKSTIYFNANGQTERKVTEWGPDVFTSVTYEWDTIGKIALLKTKFDLNQRYLAGATHVMEMELNENALPISMKNYFEPALEDTSQRYIFEYGALYVNNLLQSFHHVELNYKKDTLESSIYEIVYDEKNQMRALTIWTNGYTSSIRINSITGEEEWFTEVVRESKPKEKYNYSYDQNGRLLMTLFQLVDENNTEKEEAVIIRKTYEYDKRGNWIAIYEQTGKELKLLNTEQKIKYRK